MRVASLGCVERNSGGAPLVARSVHVLPENDALARVESRARHQVEAEQIGLALLGPTERKQDADLSAEAHEPHELRRHDPRLADDGERGLSGVRGGYALVGMASEHVGHLVSEDRGQLILGLGDLQQPRVDADLAARKRESVGLV